MSNTNHRALDILSLVDDMKSAANQILAKDISELRGFSNRQMEAIAQQANFVAYGIQIGQITEATEQFFLDSLEEMVLSFVKTLRGLLLVTIEKVWNAIVQVLWQAVGKATGINLL
ncbi:MAG: hypothetical protein ACWA5U_02975 [bacterium]